MCNPICWKRVLYKIYAPYVQNCLSSVSVLPILHYKERSGSLHILFSVLSQSYCVTSIKTGNNLVPQFLCLCNDCKNGLHRGVISRH